MNNPLRTKFAKFFAVAATVLLSVTAVSATANAAPPVPAQSVSTAVSGSAPTTVQSFFFSFWKKTTVSLTFDDGASSQLAALPIMNAYRFKGTFYINSGFTDGEGFMTRDDLNRLSSKGHEIGGHTVSHPDLQSASFDEVKREVCTDRNTLLSWGFNVRSFAYPFASFNADTEKAVQECGYNSARGLGDIKSRFGCDDCDYAETTPPENAYATRALTQVDSTWTLADFQRSVLNAEKKGGWVQFTFHEVCTSKTDCGELGVQLSTFTDFMTWLKVRTIFTNTYVKPVGDVVGGKTAAAQTAPLAPAAGPGVNGIQNAGFETLDPTTGQPSCWLQGGWGDNESNHWVGEAPRTGEVAATVELSNYASGDAKYVQQLDQGQCSPTVVPGQTYSLRSWYTSTAVTQYAVYLRSDAGTWSYWTSSPWFAASDEYVEAEWATPEIPEGYNGISFGLSMFNDGRITVDDVSMYNSIGAPSSKLAVETMIGTEEMTIAPPPEEIQDLLVQTESTVEDEEE